MIATALAGCAGGNGSLSAEPDRIEFGELPFRAGPVQRTVTIANGGTEPVRVGAVRVDGDNPARADGGCAGVVLGPGETCTVRLELEANRYGELQGDLVVAHADGALVVPFAAGGGGVPSLSLAPAELDFGTAATGEPLSRKLTVTSDGTAAAGWDEIVVEGPAARDFRLRLDGGAAGTCPAALAELRPGQRCTVAVELAAGRPGPRVAALVVRFTTRTADGVPERRETRVPLRAEIVSR